MQNMCVCSRFQSSPREFHLVVVKRIMKYLKGIISFSLGYPSGATPNLMLI